MDPARLNVPVIGSLAAMLERLSSPDLSVHPQSGPSSGLADGCSLGNPGGQHGDGEGQSWGRRCHLVHGICWSLLCLLPCGCNEQKGSCSSFGKSQEADHLLLHTDAAGVKGMEQNLGVGKLSPFKDKMIAEAIPNLGGMWPCKAIFCPLCFSCVHHECHVWVAVPFKLWVCLWVHQ